MRTAAYNNRPMSSKEHAIEVYKCDKGEKVGIKYIKVAIKRDA